MSVGNEKTSLTARARDQSGTSSSFPLNKRANEGKNTKTGDFPWDHAEKKSCFSLSLEKKEYY